MGLEGLGPQEDWDGSFSTPSPPHRLQFVLEILVLGPNDAEGHQARPRGPWGLWEGDWLQPAVLPTSQPPSPLTPWLSPLTAPRATTSSASMGSAGLREEEGPRLGGGKRLHRAVTHRFLVQV